jgi:hypothetical protein
VQSESQETSWPADRDFDLVDCGTKTVRRPSISRPPPPRSGTTKLEDFGCRPRSRP